MSKNPKPPRLSAALVEALTGLDWHWEHGKKHWQIKVGDELISVMGHGPKSREYRDTWTIENIRKWRKQRKL